VQCCYLVFILLSFISESIFKCSSSRSYHKGVKFECNTCNKRFSNKENFDLHQKTTGHTGEGESECCRSYLYTSLHSTVLLLSTHSTKVFVFVIVALCANVRNEIFENLFGVNNHGHLEFVTHFIILK
jgi:hypothetical protein